MSNHNSNGRTWLGAILIIVGALIFMKNFHLSFFHIDIFSWPFILLIIGIIVLVNHKDSFFGLFLVIIGGAGIASQYFHISFRYIFREYWPFLLIILGIYLVLKQGVRNTSNKNEFVDSEEYYLDIFSIFGEKTKKIKTNNFLGGKTTSLFGELKVDLKDSRLTHGTKELDTLTLFGATKIYLPNDWNVIIKATTIFGGFEDHRGRSEQSENTETKILIIKGLVLFGGGEIRSY